jgi:hypothetical protein
MNATIPNDCRLLSAKHMNPYQRNNSSLTAIWLLIPGGTCEPYRHKIETAQNKDTAQFCLLSGGYMAGRSRPKRAKVHGNSTKAQFAAGLADIISETTRLWRKHHLGYDQTQ